MGERWKSAEAPALDIRVRGSAPIRSIEVLGRSKVLFKRGSTEAPIGERSVELQWRDPQCRQDIADGRADGDSRFLQVVAAGRKPAQQSTE